MPTTAVAEPPTLDDYVILDEPGRFPIGELSWLTYSGRPRTASSLVTTAASSQVLVLRNSAASLWLSAGNTSDGQMDSHIPAVNSAWSRR